MMHVKAIDTMKNLKCYKNKKLDDHDNNNNNNNNNKKGLSWLVSYIKLHNNLSYLWVYLYLVVKTVVI